MLGEKVNSISGQTDSVACGWCCEIAEHSYSLGFFHTARVLVAMQIYIYTGLQTKFETKFGER